MHWDYRTVVLSSSQSMESFGPLGTAADGQMMSNQEFQSKDRETKLFT